MKNIKFLMVLLLIKALPVSAGEGVTFICVPAPSAKVLKPLYIQGSRFEGVIFSCGDSENSVTPKERCWTPNMMQIQQMESHLEAALLAGHKKYYKGPFWKSWDHPVPFAKFKRQYWGMYEKGRKVIRVSLMCREIEGWKERQTVVKDGGACYLHIFYDVKTGKFFGYMENGVG